MHQQTDSPAISSHASIPETRTPGPRRGTGAALSCALAVVLLAVSSCTPSKPPPPITRLSNLDVDPLILARVDEEVRKAADAPGNPKVRCRLAYAYDANGLEEPAITEYRALGKIAPNDPLWPYRAAICLIESGNAAGGRAEIVAVTERFPNFAPAWHRLALIHLEEGDLAAARAAIDRCLASRPLSLPGKTTLADIHLREGDAERAVSILEDVTRAATDDRHARFLLGRAYQRTGRDDAVVEVLLSEGAGAVARAVEDPREQTMAGLQTGLAREVDRGIALIQAGRAADAVRVLEAALRAHPNDSNIMLNLAQARAQAGDTPGALSMIKTAAETDSKNFRVHLVRAILELGAGDAAMNPKATGSLGAPPPAASDADREKARKHYETALASGSRAARFGPKEWRSHFTYARAAHRSGQLDLARSALEKAQQIVPNDAEVNQFMFELTWQLNDRKAALAALERVVAVNPNNLVSWVNLVHTRAALEDFEGAAAALERARAIDPGHPRVIGAAEKLDTLRAAAGSSQTNSPRSP